MCVYGQLLASPVCSHLAQHLAIATVLLVMQYKTSLDRPTVIGLPA